MCQPGSLLHVYDNSGVYLVKCFKNLTYQNNKTYSFLIKISVQEIKQTRKVLVKKGQIYNALIIKSRYMQPRFNGQQIKFDTNGCILVNNINFKNKKTRNKITLIGTSIFGLIQKEFRLYSIKLNINSINIL